MKQRVEEMEREAKKLREMQAAAEKAADTSEGGESAPMDTEEDKNLIDSRSVYVGNVCILFFLSYASFDAQSRSTMALRPRKFKDTFSLAVR